MSCFHLLPTIPLQSKIKSIECCYILLPLLYLFIAAFGTVSQFVRIATDYKSALSPYAAIANDINTSLLQRPITDLKVVNTSEWYCPEGYNMLNMSFWPGNEGGCYNNHNETLHSSSCTNVHGPHDNSSVWKNIISNPRIVLYFWGTYKFCAKYDHYIPVNSSTLQCPPGYKTCSKGRLCAVQASQCPVTSIGLNWQNNGWNLSMALSLDVVNDPEENPLIGVSTSVNGLPCLNPTRRPVLDSAPTYPLEADRPQGCDKFGTNKDTAQGVDQESLLQFYTENNMGEYIDKMPDYSDYLKQGTTVLYTRSQVEVNMSTECQNVAYLMKTIGENVNEFTFSSGIMTTLIAYNVIVVIFGFVMFFYLYVDKENEERDKYFREQKCLFHSFHFIPYILCVFSIAQYSQIPENGGPAASNLLNLTSTIIDNQCFIQNQYNDVFVQLQNDVIGNTDYFFGATQTMGIISYIFVLLMLGIRGLRGYYMREVKEFESKYLEDRFALSNRSQAETELSSSGMENQQVGPQEDYEDVYRDIV